MLEEEDQETFTHAEMHQLPSTKKRRCTFSLVFNAAREGAEQFNLARRLNSNKLIAWARNGVYSYIRNFQSEREISRLSFNDREI